MKLSRHGKTVLKRYEKMHGPSSGPVKFFAEADLHDGVLEGEPVMEAAVGTGVDQGVINKSAKKFRRCEQRN